MANCHQNLWTALFDVCYSLFVIRLLGVFGIHSFLQVEYNGALDNSVSHHFASLYPFDDNFNGP